MRLLISILVFVGLASAAPAFAAESPSIAPAGDWVEKLEIPAPNAALKGKPLQALLLSSQTRYRKDRAHEYFFEYATLIQDPQGLAQLGNVVLAWQPDQAELVVHKVHILRDGKVIDVLGNGQQFTVLRRENNLESAMLDGVLTAALQPEGLAVGDIVNVAWTMRLKPGSLPLAPENLVVVGHGGAIRHARIRESWEEGVPIRWQASEVMGKSRLRKERGVSELVFDLNDAEGPEPPEDAPARFLMPAGLEVTGYKDWSEVSGLMAPLYRTAQQIAPSSPLKGEIERIAAASPDPRRRAMAALRLVQERIRYLALAMGDGGYVPATADQTWSRKFGDCKGKTATLLALLQGLGIEAEPVLVSSVLGDGLNERLPIVRLFDHVLVRARIDGRSYWLDGTRQGDRQIEELASSPFRWGLPLRADGGELEQLPATPPPSPLIETNLTYDASAGFAVPVPFSGEIVFRGDLGAGMRHALAEAGKDKLREQMERFRTEKDGEEITDFDIIGDDEAGTAIFRFKGKAKMGWWATPATKGVRYQFDDDTIQWKPQFKRKEGPSKDAPFALAFPAYLASTETVILPKGGAGFTLEGKDLERTIAGTLISRRLTLQGDRAVARSTFKRLQPEISAAEARAAEGALKAVNQDAAYIRAPANYDETPEERAALLASDPKDAIGFLDRGSELLRQLRYKSALADFDQAIELSPDWSSAHAYRAIALISLDKAEEARASVEKAQALGEEDALVWEAVGLLHLAQDRPAQAVEALNRSLVLQPDVPSTLGERAAAFGQLGKLPEALADIERGLRANPQSWGFTLDKARLLSALGRPDEAIRAAASLRDLDKDNPSGAAAYAWILRRAGRTEEARRATADAVAQIDRRIAAAGATDTKPLKLLRAQVLADGGDLRRGIQDLDAMDKALPSSATTLGARCWTRAMANIELELALKDCTRAMAIDPENAAVADSLGLVELRLGHLDAAIAHFDKAIEWGPSNAPSYYVRGIARLRKGEREAGERDLAKARRLLFDIDARYVPYGIGPPGAETADTAAIPAQAAASPQS